MNDQNSRLPNNLSVPYKFFLSLSTGIDGITGMEHPTFLPSRNT